MIKKITANQRDNRKTGQPANRLTSQPSNRPTGQPANRPTKTGQALVELAVFGTIFLMILGALVSYGLKFNFQQQAQMEAFRRALAIASNTNDATNTGSGSYSVIKDKHIPDPLDIFGIGSSTPISASASVTRTHYLDSQPVDYNGLPTSVMDIQTSRVEGPLSSTSTSTRIISRNAGFRIEYNVLDDDNVIKKYGLIYGSVYAWNGSDWVTTDDAGVQKTGNNCTDVVDADGNPTGEQTCESYTIARIRILDSCVGDMVDYNSCYAQAVKLVDFNRCYTYCTMTRTQDSEYSCTDVCNSATNPPNQTSNQYSDSAGGAWYAHNWTKTGNTYTFPVLDQMFSFAGASGIKAMGPQSDMTINSTRDTSLEKIETTTAIQTDERTDWADTTTKQFVVNDNLQTTGGVDVSGFEYTYPTAGDFANQTQSTTMTSQVSGSAHQVWTTDK